MRGCGGRGMEALSKTCGGGNSSSTDKAVTTESSTNRESIAEAQSPHTVLPSRSGMRLMSKDKKGLARRRELHNIISERQRRYHETVLAMGGTTEEDVKPVVVAVSQAVCKQNEKFIIKRLKVKMANCFDFRHRATSFDLHTIGHGTKMSLLSKLFRSKSDSNVKAPRSPRESPGTSPRTSPKGSPGAPPKRRFMRVIRDDKEEGEEYVNPHVVRKYNPGFWEKQYMLKKSHSLDETTDRPLPYTVTGHTILKKHHSFEENQSSASNSPTGEKKHATFKEVVEVVEYHPKTRCKLILEDSCIVKEKLHDEWEECLDVEYQVPREECENINEEESCKAILDIVLDQVSRSIPLEQINERDEEAECASEGLSAAAGGAEPSPVVAMEEGEQLLGAAGGAAASPTEVLTERQSSSESDIVEAKRSKLDEKGAPSTP